MSIAVPQPPRLWPLLTTAALLPCLVLGQTTAKPPGSTPDAAKGTTTYLQATVHALWKKDTSRRDGSIGEPVGGATPFTVRVSPNPDGAAGVGFIEQVPGSTGQEWKSAAWIAALAACHANNDLLTDHEFLLRVRGSIDGASAGMIMAATMLALIKRDAVLPDVSITGTINPDGTVGPVSSIPYKVEGAAKAGLTKLGYPLICDGDEEAYKKEMEDMGRSRGVTMVPLTDINDAYELLTGVSLGHTKPLPAEEMKPSAARNEWLRTAAAALLDQARTRLAAAEKKGLALAPKLSAVEKAEFATDRARAEKYVAASEASAAKQAFRLAHYQATLAEQNTRMIAKWLEWHQDDDVNRRQSLYLNQRKAVEDELATTLTAVQDALKSPLLAARIAAFDTCVRYWNAQAQFNAAKQDNSEKIGPREEAIANARRLAKSDKEKKELRKAMDELEEVILGATEGFAQQEGRIRAIAGFVGVSFDDSSRQIPEQTILNQRLAAAFGPTAKAGLDYVKSLTIRPRTNGAADPAAQVRAYLQARDQALAVCKAAVEYALPREDSNGGAVDSPETVMDRVACGATAYLAMTSLMNKYYNLQEGIQMPGAAGTGSITRMIERSRSRVLEEAARVKAELKFIPDSIRLSFDGAESAQMPPPGAPAEEVHAARLDALTAYRRAHFLCRMALMMAKGK